MVLKCVNFITGGIFCIDYGLEMFGFNVGGIPVFAEWSCKG